MLPTSEWKWYGTAAHFICSARCKFHLATLVGKYIISTVGEYIAPDNRMESNDYYPIGAGNNRLYETMVFRWGGETCNCGCGLPVPADWREIDAAYYADARSATAGHMGMCRAYAEREEESSDVHS